MVPPLIYNINITVFHIYISFHDLRKTTRHWVHLRKWRGQKRRSNKDRLRKLSRWPPKPRFFFKVGYVMFWEDTCADFWRVFGVSLMEKKNQLEESTSFIDIWGVWPFDRLGMLVGMGCTLPERNSSHLKMDDWNTIVSFWGPAYFHGRKCSF